MTGLVEQLRRIRPCEGCELYDALTEAADEIERLREDLEGYANQTTVLATENKRLREERDRIALHIRAENKRLRGVMAEAVAWLEQVGDITTHDFPYDRMKIALGDTDK